MWDKRFEFDAQHVKMFGALGKQQHISTGAKCLPDRNRYGLRSLLVRRNATERILDLRLSGNIDSGSSVFTARRVISAAV